MKNLHCTLKFSAFEKSLVFPRLKKYCIEHKIQCTLQAEKQDGETVYRMRATANPEVIDECAKEIGRLGDMFPGRISNLKVIFA